jgi:cytosine/adenosine deaminase-related metal-dependent hydrolase
MLEMGVRGIMFQETFGSGPEQCDASINALRARVAELAPKQTDLVRLGISPHAPYTVADVLYAACADFAREDGWRMGLHIAESASEQELVVSGTGPFAEEWKERDLEVVPRGRSPVAVLEKTGCLATSPLLIHAVRLDSEDIETIARHNCTVAHCPASNAKFGHGIAPLAQYLEAGITVGLGSDSVASNNRMDILEEARLAVLFQRALHRNETTIPAHTALELATIGGARALRIDDKVGSLEVGKDADLSVFSLSAAHVTPVGNVDAAIIFALAGAKAQFVAVKGRPLLVDGRVVDLDPGLQWRVHAAALALSTWEKNQSAS